MYPATETTKGEILSYYARAGETVLAHLAGRPVTRVRWPHGTGGESFFEKNLPSGAPSWLPRVQVHDVTYPLVDDLAQLTYLVNLNSIELHVPQWRVDDEGTPRNPDRLVIDLDPGKPAGLHECARVALLLRERLGGLGLDLHPVTSGSKGMQLYARLGGDLTSDQVRDLTQQLAQEMTRKHPDLVLWKMTKTLRPGKVSSTGARMSRPRRRSAPTRCAGATTRGSRRPAPGTRSRPAPRTPTSSSSSTSCRCSTASTSTVTCSPRCSSPRPSRRPSRPATPRSAAPRSSRAPSRCAQP